VLHNQVACTPRCTESSILQTCDVSGTKAPTLSFHFNQLSCESVYTHICVFVGGGAGFGVGGSVSLYIETHCHIYVYLLSFHMHTPPISHICMFVDSHMCGHAAGFLKVFLGPGIVCPSLTSGWQRNVIDTNSLVSHHFVASRLERHSP
jgi:hypothetical protein